MENREAIRKAIEAELRVVEELESSALKRYELLADRSARLRDELDRFDAGVDVRQPMVVAERHEYRPEFFEIFPWCVR